MIQSPSVEQILRNNGLSITKPRKLVFNLLQKNHRPLSVIEIHGKLPDIDKVSVYRTVYVFEKVGITHRVWNGFKSKIELSEEFSPHHHHFTCLNCGLVVSLESENLESALRTFEASHEFRLTQHSVELSGYCKNCSTKTAQIDYITLKPISRRYCIPSK